jgi:hypothetical protein
MSQSCKDPANLVGSGLEPSIGLGLDPVTQCRTLARVTLGWALEGSSWGSAGQLLVNPSMAGSSNGLFVGRVSLRLHLPESSLFWFVCKFRYLRIAFSHNLFSLYD